MQIKFRFDVLEENIKPLTGACHGAGRRTWCNSSYLHRPSSSLQSFMAFSGLLASDVGQSSGWDSHSVNANHKVFGLFVPLFDFGDKDDKILTWILLTSFQIKTWNIIVREHVICFVYLISLTKYKFSLIRFWTYLPGPFAIWTMSVIQCRLYFKSLSHFLNSNLFDAVNQVKIKQ